MGGSLGRPSSMAMERSTNFLGMSAPPSFHDSSACTGMVRDTSFPVPVVFPQDSVDPYPQGPPDSGENLLKTMVIGACLLVNKSSSLVVGQFGLKKNECIKRDMLLKTCDLDNELEDENHLEIYRHPTAQLATAQLLVLGQHLSCVEQYRSD